ncbi:class I SAM-dependent methyltransferase [Salinarchaeum laminariae]|uniref:class I SAM-dependent methyltransferase n=1 Tax=Salinarchaeum laminariae TaxID=869888 RepID=UPI0020BE48EA|nr:class I SAM-dependent methyltransferase family protein [Salinarchaeum laminariae]
MSEDDAGENVQESTEQTTPLAAVVPKSRGEAPLEALRESGEYDDSRRICEYDDGTIAIPVSDPVSPGRQAALGIVEIVRQEDPEPRATGLDGLLAERGWTDEHLDSAPGSWAVVGTVVLVDVPEDCHDETAVGEALLELHREADTVLAREGIDGQTRDPDLRVIAGIGTTETIHTEHGVRYALDLADVMFSPGNEAERGRMAALVAAGRDKLDPVATIDSPAEQSTAATPDQIPQHIPDLDPAADAEPDDSVTLDDVGGPTEHVFDMFAGAGYFTLPAAIAGAEVSAAEIDPDAFQYLIENAQLNGVGDRVAAYLSDCREVAEVVTADRVIMGHYDAVEYLDAAFEAVRDGGVLHVHAVVPEPELWDRALDRIHTAAAEAGRSVEIEDTRRIKSYGEGVWHVVVDVRVAAT